MKTNDIFAELVEHGRKEIQKLEDSLNEAREHGNSDAIAFYEFAVKDARFIVESLKDELNGETE
jgi:hypothetical protein